MVIKFNPEKIVSYSIHGSKTEEAPYFRKFRKGDIRQREIKLFGFVIVKEERYEEDWFDFCYDIDYLTRSELEERFDGKFNYYFEQDEKTGKWYYRPYIRFKLVNDDSREVYFENEEEMYSFIDNFKEKYNVDLNNFINYGRKQ